VDDRSELLTLKPHGAKAKIIDLSLLVGLPVFTRRLRRERIEAVPALASSRWPSAL
jgi:hypothetical protein